MPKRHRRRHHRRLRRSNKPSRKNSLFERISYFSRKHPIAVGAILIIAALILFRLSFSNPILSGGEVAIWVWIASVILFIAGLLVLKGWWMNNIVTNNTKHQVTWKNR